MKGSPGVMRRHPGTNSGVKPGSGLACRQTQCSTKLTLEKRWILDLDLHLIVKELDRVSLVITVAVKYWEKAIKMPLDALSMGLKLRRVLLKPISNFWCIYQHS